MAATPLAPFLLHSIRAENLRSLSQVLWEWQPCNSCRDKFVCDHSTCPWSKAGRLQTFFDRYRDLTKAYAPEFPVTRPALSSHDDLVKLIRLIRTHPDVERNQLLVQHFGSQSTSVDRTAHLDQNRALNVAASIVFLTNWGTSLDCVDFLEEGGSSVPWRDNVTAIGFVEELYPAKSSPLLGRRVDIGSLTACNLIKAGFQLQPTTDLRQHFAMVHYGRKKVIRVYHCAAVLKEMLLAPYASNTTCLLPRALALEALYTLYHVLFPPDADSQTLLSTLIRKYRFDDDLRQYEQSRYKRDDDPDVDYSYYGVQMADVYDELREPRPRPGWESWFQKYSAQRYMLMATMIGVFIAVLLGILGLGVSAFQAWVSYQQWKHPVKEG
ncbi:hypothetical protein T440DRAFT_552295 [Plenodomus tracheiphilus IPT5]|uniref:Uncharacterized protein n=1 Tax=Plenodomus tracheiphilus IPT5 TaxID=1408161 RepID=A0A6A7BJ18_9PLEO|nr:hypothetical protein T440DRAFT_552295 [Plenodomus tracheiphilus IPT5]